MVLPGRKKDPADPQSPLSALEETTGAVLAARRAAAAAAQSAGRFSPKSRSPGPGRGVVRGPSMSLSTSVPESRLSHTTGHMASPPAGPGRKALAASLQHSPELRDPAAGGLKDPHELICSPTPDGRERASSSPSALAPPGPTFLDVQEDSSKRASTSPVGGPNQTGRARSPSHVSGVASVPLCS